EIVIAGRWFSMMFVPILDSGYVNLYGRDITLRKDGELEQERLARENQVQKTLLESIFEADPGAIAVVVGEDLHFVYVNPAYRYVTPDPIKDPVGSSYESVWPHRSKYSHRDRYREVIRTGNPFQATGVLHLFPDGCQRVFTVQARRIQWEELPACLIIMWDVTELESTRQQLADELQKRQAAEKAVEAEKERFLTSLTSIGDAVITTDPQGRVTFMNPVAEQLTGWPFADALDRPLEEVFPIINERTLEPVENPVGKVLQLGLVIGLANHTALIARDGRKIPVEDSAAPIKNTAGETLGVVMVFHDVTEKRKAEETLRQLNRMIDLSAEPIFSWELDGGILTWNQGCEQLYGFMRAEAVGQVSHELLNTRHPLPLESFKAQLVRDGGWTGVLHQLTRDGRELVIETRHELMDIAGRKVVLETNRDITDRRRLDEQIHLQIAALEATANGVVITDRKGLIEWANPAFTALTGYSTDEAGGKNPSTLVRSGVHDRAFYQNMWGTILAGKVWRGEIVNRRKDGSLYNEEMTITPVADEQGEISHFIAIKQDISGRKKSEQEARAHVVQIELQQRLLEQREQERLQVARDLHDGPVQELTAVSFELQGLLDSAGSAEEVEKLQKIKAAVLAQVAELRSYAGELRPPTLSKFGLEKAVRSHVEDLQEKHPEVVVRLTAQPGSDELPERARLAFFRIYQQAVNNILKHASASEVQIRLSRTEMEKIDGTARFRFEMEIRDNGRGFDPPPDWVELARQGHFGLVGMRERAEAVGARLELRSAPKSGTTVQVAIDLDG
ncbi:MAG TPA: PAS domain S-box protein, partial [Anaerolineaceae bacterium]